MESPAWGRVTHQRLTKNISLLWLLGEEPAELTESSILQRFRERNASARVPQSRTRRV